MSVWFFLSMKVKLFRMNRNDTDHRKYWFGPLKEVSGFYTLIEDELFGPGKRYVYEPAYGQTNPPTVIRCFGIIWDTPIKVRMYLYTPTPYRFFNLETLSKAIETQCTQEFLSKLHAPYLQHNFAAEDGTVKDQVKFWKFEDNSLCFTDSIRCIKLVQERHLSAGSFSEYDLHVLVGDLQ